MLLLIAILLPIVSGALLPLFRFRTVKARGIYTESAVLLTSAVTLYTIILGKSEPFCLITVLDGLDVILRADGLSRVFAGLISVLWPLANLYALEYMESEERRNVFFAFYTITYGVTLGIAFAGTLFTMYIFYEFMTIITLPLVVHKHDGESSRAGRKYVYFSIAGAAMALIAVMFVTVMSENTLFTFGGTLSGERMSGLEEALKWIFLLAFFGFGVKAAVFPMSAWLPAASVAPTPVTALLHAVAVVNSGAFAVIRTIYYAFGTEFLAGTIVRDIALAVSCFTVLYGSVMAVREQHLKRRLAYSTVSNLSYMLMGACLMTKAGLTGALTHLIAHSFMKITLFYCAGAIMIRTGCHDVRETRGLWRKMPVTAVVFTVASAALVGTPPLCGFVSKWNLLTAASETGTILGIAAVCVIIISAVLTAIYLFSVAFGFFFRPSTDETKASDPGIMMKLPMIALCAATVLLGLFFGPIIEILKIL